MAVRIIISDLHVGARNSLFTGLNNDINPNTKIDTCTNLTLMSALQSTIKGLSLSEKPDLILNGDVLDLSFASPKNSTTALQTFFHDNLIYKETDKLVFGNLYYLPGNHDHEVWTADRFSQDQTDNLNAQSSYFWRHTTEAFAPRDQARTTTVINEVLANAGVNQKVATYNPNMGWLSQDGKRAIVVHHGHYIEATYTLMTRFLELLSGSKSENWSAEQLEQANASWIDFGWSTLGDLGELGDDMTMFMKLLATGGASHQLQNRISTLLGKQLQELLPLPHTQQISQGLDYLSHALIDTLLGKFSTLERFNYTKLLSSSSIEGLHRYLAQTVRWQIEEELKNHTPEHLTFVFGHTHKPFEDQIVVEGFARPVSIYNTGGWVLDTALFSTVEGASIVFVDDDLNTAAIRLFDMPVNRKTVVADDGTVLPDENDVGSVKVVSSDPTPNQHNPMFKKLFDAVNENKEAWYNFSYFVELALLEKQQMYFKNAEIAEENSKRTGGLV